MHALRRTAATAARKGRAAPPRQQRRYAHDEHHHHHSEPVNESMGVRQFPLRAPEPPCPRRAIVR